MQRQSHPNRPSDERWQAQKLLNMLAIQEPHAKFWEEQERVRETLSTERAFWHDRLARAFERSVGVPPDRRGDLREGLERIVRTGVGRVDEILTTVQTNAQVKGDSVVDSGPTDS